MEENLGTNKPKKNKKQMNKYMASPPPLQKKKEKEK